jgi:hypothetical protein
MLRFSLGPTSGICVLHFHQAQPEAGPKAPPKRVLVAKPKPSLWELQSRCIGIVSGCDGA